MGVTVETVSPGDGTTFPKKGDKVYVHYKGTLNDGTVVDSSYERYSGEPFITEIGVGKVIRGWDEGIVQMSVGEKAILVSSADYSYGSRGFPPVIPPDSELKFEVHLVRVVPK